jgi:hypothetical protein
VQQIKVIPSGISAIKIATSTREIAIINTFNDILHNNTIDTLARE